MVNQSLLMPQQPNKSSSAANAQHRAFKHSRKSPATMADNVMDSRMNLILRTPSGSGKVSLTSQVANQHYWNSAIKDGYTTNILDQGISIDVSGQPYDLGVTPTPHTPQNPYPYPFKTPTQGVGVGVENFYPWVIPLSFSMSSQGEELLLEEVGLMKFSIMPRSILENVEDRRKLVFILPEYFGDLDGDTVENPV
jgi:hypothetical protein